jgi:hypothetical protein
LWKERFLVQDLFGKDYDVLKNSDNENDKNIVEWLSKFRESDMWKWLIIKRIEPNMDDNSVSFSFDDKWIDANYNRNFKIENCIVNWKIDMNIFKAWLKNMDWAIIFKDMSENDSRNEKPVRWFFSKVWNFFTGK